MIENSAEELLYDLEDVEEQKYQQYLEEQEWYKKHTNQKY
jgi:hypothetical protein